MVRPEDVVEFVDRPAPPGATPWVGGYEPQRDIRIVPSDPAWPAAYRALEERIRGALGPAAIDIAHVGSTSVPGLAAKPIIDIDVLVADSADEDAYRPAMERAGLVLRIREPWWYEHRVFESGEPPANVHVFSHDAPEPVRHRLFRDWLRAHPDDRDLYRDAKIVAADEANADGEHVMQYNARKQGVIREIYGRAFAAAGLLPDE